MTAAENNGWQRIDENTPKGVDVLVFCEETKEQFVAYQEDRSIRGLFCFAIHRGAYIMCRPQWWKPLDNGPVLQ